MILSFTDKFLWDIYKFVEKTDRAYDFFAPRSMRYMDFVSFRHMRELVRKKDRRKISYLIYYLKKKGYIKIKNLEQKKAILITKKGTDKILRIKIKTNGKKKRFDGKWQMLIFDIPERKRYLRSLLRESLRFLGYKMLQQSAWVCPYDVSQETEDILRINSLDHYVKIFLIEEIEM